MLLAVYVIATCLCGMVSRHFVSRSAGRVLVTWLVVCGLWFVTCGVALAAVTSQLWQWHGWAPRDTLSVTVYQYLSLLFDRTMPCFLPLTNTRKTDGSIRLCQPDSLMTSPNFVLGIGEYTISTHTHTHEQHHICNGSWVTQILLHCMK